MTQTWYCNIESLACEYIPLVLSEEFDPAVLAVLTLFREEGGIAFGLYCLLPADGGIRFGFALLPQSWKDILFVGP